MSDETLPEAASTSGAAPAATPDTDSAAAIGSDPDWRDGLPAPLRRVAEKFPTPADAIKSYAALERRLGRSVVIPERDATADEIAAFHSRLGRPDTPDGYEVRVPDGVPDHLRPGPESAPARDDFLAAMHAAGASPTVVQAAFDWYYAASAAADATTDRERARKDAAAETELRREWGRDYDRNAALAARTLRRFGDGDLAEAVARAGLDRHPAWLRALSRLGRATSEDELLSGDGSAPGGDARRRIDTIMDEHFGKPSYGAADVQNELRGLYGALYGTGGPDQGEI